ncbi:MAG: SNF2-related protein [Clostridia bacterium]
MRRLTPLLKYQKQCFEKLKKNKVGLLSMDMGTGKTRTIIEILNFKYEQNKINKILYFCPLSTMSNIKEQFRIHCPDMLSIPKFCGIESISSSEDIYLDCLKYVDNYTGIVVDESTLIKNYFSKRTRRITKIGELTKYKWILSGNPIPNTIADIYSQLNFLSPAILEYYSWYDFARNHVIFDKHYPDRILKTFNETYIAEKMQPYVFQIKKSDCLELPNKNYEYRTCMANTNEFETYNFIKEKCIEDIIENSNGMEYCSMLLKLLHFSAKIKSRFKLLEDILEELNLKNNKVIIFCRHIDIQKKLYELLKSKYSVVFSNGQENNIDVVLQNFKKSKQILLLTYGVGSYGLNLQFANYMIMFENIFDYNLLQQSEERIHRFGQTQKCYYIYLQSNFKIETLVQNNIRSKINTIKWFEDELKKITLDASIDKRKELRKLFEVI